MAKARYVHSYGNSSLKKSGVFPSLFLCTSLRFLGADVSDYFNYGFNEETRKIYCEKQKKMRTEAQSAEVRRVFSAGFVDGCSLNRSCSSISCIKFF